LKIALIVLCTQSGFSQNIFELNGNVGIGNPNSMLTEGGSAPLFLIRELAVLYLFWLF